MNLRQLEVFQAVFQTGNMSAAARLLCITPSAVSKAVAHTELQLGYRLFVRTPAGLTPTPEAQVLASESTGIYRQLDALKRTARNLATSDSGDVRLAAIPSVSHEFLPRLLQQHAAQHPQVGSELLVSGRMYLAVAPALWSRAPRAATPAARLARVPVIRLVGDDPMRQAIDDLAQRMAAPDGPGVQVQTSRLALELVKLGMG